VTSKLDSLCQLLIICLSPSDAPSFSIAVICVSVHGGTRLLGMVKASKREILLLVEQKQCRDLQLAVRVCYNYTDGCNIINGRLLSGP
jgi:hypothetical protein